MRALLSAFASNVVFANIMIFLMFLVGAISLVQMRRELAPEMSLDRVVVTVPYPGADPAEIEEGILRKIEDAVQGEQGVKEIQSQARENIGTVVVTVEEGASTQRVLDRVRSQVDGIGTFPAGAENPMVTELLIEDTAAILALSGEMGEARMRAWAERFRTELLEDPAITVVEIVGVRDPEITVGVSEARLRTHRIGLDDVAEAIRRHNQDIPGGLLRGPEEEIRLRTLGRRHRGEEFADIPVRARPGGEILKLGDLAEVVDGFTEDALRTRADGVPAALLYVQRVGRQDAIRISEAVLRVLDAHRAGLPDGLRAEVVFDTTDLLQARIDLLVRNGIIGLVLVLFLLWLFLDLRLSFWAGMGLPISMAGAMVILWAVGGSINMVSLFGFILVLGIIVDDAIVVGESIHHHQSKPGARTFAAAVDGVAEVALPVLGAVTTTMIAFLPLMFIGGIMGRFISILPVVVMACLGVSLIECLLLLPAHLGAGHHRAAPSAPSEPRHLVRRFHRATGRALGRFIEGPYRRFLGAALRGRYLLLCGAAGLLMVVAGLVGGRHIPVQLFPTFDSFILTAIVEFPEGTPIDVTDAALDRIEAAAFTLNDTVPTRRGEPAVRKIVRLAGRNLNDPYSPPGHHLGSVQVILVEGADRELDSEAVRALWTREIGEIPGAVSSRVEGLAAGPPGKPIEIRVRGHDMGALQRAARDLRDRLATYPGVVEIEDDYRAGLHEVQFRLRPEAATLGVTVEDIGQQVRAAVYGIEAVRIQRGRDEVRVMVRAAEGERRHLADLDRLRVRTPDGREIPLRAVARFESGPGLAAIHRLDGLRVVRVTADVDPEITTAAAVTDDLERHHFDEVRRAHPGVRIEFGGEMRDAAEAFGSLRIGFPVALVGVFVILVAIFRSYVQPFVIMVTVPFGIVGAVIGHVLLGIELSMMSLFGVVALTGVVVNDAIVLIESYNAHLGQGLDVAEALPAAACRRFRAVFLTTLSTVGGLTPLILETDLQAQILIPMAVSLAAGVAFATLMTLVLLPSLLMILSDLRCLARYLLDGEWPARRADIEPAVERFRLQNAPATAET